MAKFYTIQDVEGAIVYAGGYPSAEEKQNAFAICMQRAGVDGQSTRLVKEQTKSSMVKRFTIVLNETTGWVGTYEIITQA